MSRSKVGVKVMGRGQRPMSNFWCAAVDIRGSAMQSKVFACVSVISGCKLIIAHMQAICFKSSRSIRCIGWVHEVRRT